MTKELLLGLFWRGRPPIADKDNCARVNRGLADRLTAEATLVSVLECCHGLSASDPTQEQRRRPPAAAVSSASRSVNHKLLVATGAVRDCDAGMSPRPIVHAGPMTSSVPRPLVRERPLHPGTVVVN